MPGDVPNSTIKLAIDQVIVAINSLRSATIDGATTIADASSGSGSVTSIEAITAKLEEIRTLYETESLAQIVAQNTNFSDLIAILTTQTAAISALTLSCQTIVETTNLNQTIQVNGGGGCGAGGPGTNAPVDPTYNEPTPPPGYTTPIDPTLSRRCKAANVVHENIKAWVYTLDQHGVDAFANQAIPITLVLFVALLAQWVSALGVTVTILGATVGEIAGYLTSQAIALLRGDVDAAQIHNLLDDPDLQQDFICALYEENGPQSSISRYLQVCSDNGMSLANRDFVALVFSGEMAYFLFWAKDQYIEDLLETYEPTTPCDDCNQAGPYTVLLGTETSTHPANPIVITTEYNPARSGCGTNVREITVVFQESVTIPSITVAGNGPGACGGTSIYNYYSNEDFTGSISSGNGRPQDSSIPSGVRSMILVYNDDGNSPTVTITYTLD
jgi:hypothetical protein